MKKIRNIITILLTMLMVTSGMPLSALAAAPTNKSAVLDTYRWSYTANDSTLYIDTLDQGATLSGSQSGGALPIFTQTDQNNFAISGEFIDKIIFGSNIGAIQGICLDADSYPALQTVEFEEGTEIDTIPENMFCDSAIEYIEIPDSVTLIGELAFGYCMFLSEITIPESVVKINAYAFQGCERLERVNISSNVSLSRSIFAECVALETLDLSATNIKTVPSHLCEGCTSLKSVILPSTVTKIQSYAFYETLIESFDFTGITSIGTSAFALSGIKSADFSGVTTIMSKAFCKTPLESANFNGVESIGTQAFYETELETVVLNDASSIGESAFEKCKKLRTLEINANLGNIENEINLSTIAFKDCTALSSVTLSPYLTYLDMSAFENCTALTSLTFTSMLDNENNVVGLRYFDGASMNGTGIKHIKLPSTIEDYTFTNSTIESVDLSDVTLEYIPGEAFAGCFSMTHFEIPESCVEIYNNAFAYSGIENITIPDSVMAIENEAFIGCENLESVTLGSGLIEISSGAFAGCTSLESIEIPDSVNRIGREMFFECSNLTSVKWSRGCDTIEYSTFEGCERLSEITGTENVIAVGNRAFADTAISNIDFLPVIEEIGTCAFEDCLNLRNVTIPQSITETGNHIFKNCMSIETMTLDSSNAGESLAEGLTGLKTVNIGEHCANIPEKAFKDTRIENLNFSPNNTESIIINASAFANTTSLNPITLPDNIVSICDNAFDSSTGITGELHLGDQLLAVGTSAFQNTAVTSVTGGKSLVGIGQNAFENCSQLESVNIGDGNTDSISVLGDAFKDCTALRTFVVDSKSTSIGAAFSGTAIESVTLTGNGIKSISSNALKNIQTLNRVDLSNGNVNIYSSAFENCTSLTEVILPQGELSRDCTIDASAFRNTRITEIVIPKNISAIGNYAFADIPTLESVEFNVAARLKTIGSYAFQNGKISGELELPANVTTVSAGAFKNNLITSVVLPKSITTVGQNAFMANPLETLISYSTNDVNFTYNAFFTDSNGNFLENGTVKARPSSNFKAFALAKNYTFIAIDANGNEVEQTLLKGTWNGGTWEATTQDLTNYTIYIKGSGAIDPDSFRDSSGRATTIKDVISENPLLINGISFGEGITEIPDYFLCYDESYDYIASPAKKIKKYVFPSTLEKIGAYAFSGCYLDKLEIPNSVTELGAHCFQRSYITSLKLSTGTKTIPEYAFYQATLPYVINIPEGVERLEKSSFATNIYIEKVDIYVPKSLKYIYYAGDNSYNNAIKFYVSAKIHGRRSTEAYRYTTKCKSTSFVLEMDRTFDLTHPSVYDASGDITISTGTGKWYYTAADKTLYIAGNGSVVGDIDSDFEYDVKTVVFEYGMTGYSTYNESIVEKYNPDYIYIPTSFIAMTKDCLRGCTNLRSLIIPDSIRTLHPDLLRDCKSLRYIKFGGNILEIPDNFCKNLNTLEVVDLGDSVEKIGAYAFRSCTGLTIVNIPDSVYKVGAYAFSKCVNVNKLIVGTDLYDLGEKCFSNMAYCETIEISSQSFFDGVTTDGVDWFKIFENIGASTTGTTLVLDNEIEVANLKAFNNTRITEIVIGDNINSIVNITNLPYLQEIRVSENNTNYYSYNGCLYSNDDCLVLVPCQIDDVVIKDGTTKIGDGAMASCMLEDIHIPQTVTEIGAYAFNNCKYLQTINLPNSVTTIGNSAFENCNRLRVFYAPARLESIGSRAFANCTSLGTAILSANRLQTIGSEAFRGCSQLIGMVLPENLSTIGDKAYMDCPEMTEIYIWYDAVLGEQVFRNDNKLTIYTMAGSDAYRYAREFGVNYSAYTDDETFYDICADKMVIYAGYLGMCSEGHGNIEWLTVYSADCEHDGYMIGVCEYCSEILDERHTVKTGHNYSVTAQVEATATTKGITQYTCSNCGGQYSTYTDATSSDFTVETHTVSGSVVISLNNTATSGKSPAKNANIVIDGDTVATTDENGRFSFELETGTYEAQIVYAYGFTRTVYIVVENRDVSQMEIPIIGCDFNKDGKIDDDDLKLFQIVISSSKNDPSYLDFVDMNNDGYINAKDRMYIVVCKGLNAKSFVYPTIVIKK